MRFPGHKTVSIGNRVRVNDALIMGFLYPSEKTLKLVGRSWFLKLYIKTAMSTVTSSNHLGEIFEKWTCMFKKARGSYDSNGFRL